MQARCILLCSCAVTCVRMRARESRLLAVLDQVVGGPNAATCAKWCKSGASLVSWAASVQARASAAAVRAAPSTGRSRARAEQLVWP